MDRVVQGRIVWANLLDPQGSPGGDCDFDC
jgi:hypothetical protein